MKARKQKISDIFTVDSGIFTVFQANFAELFGTLFPTITAAELNIFTLLRHGNKYVTEYLAKARELGNSYVSNIIDAVISCYQNTWVAIANGINAEIDYTGVTTRTKGGTVERETDGTNNDTTFERVFNDNEPQNTETQQSENNGTQVDTYDLVETERKQLQAAEIKQLIALKRQNLYTTIIDDICSELTIRIY